MEVTRSRRRNGFTLVELVLTLGVMLVLVVAANAVVSVCGRSVDMTRDQQRGREVEQFVERLRFDLAEATSLTTLTSTEVRFAVPDRDGDAVAESLGYSWSGTANAAIHRLDGGASDAALARVTSFSVTPVSTFERSAPSTVTTGEVLLAASAGGGTSATLSLGSVSAAGLVVRPALPAAAVSWSVTRMRFLAKRGIISLGTLDVAVRTTSGGLPAAVVESKSVSGALLNLTATWQDVSFASSTFAATQSEVAVVIAPGTTSGVSLDTTTSAPSWATWATSAGSTWTAVSGVEPAYELYGKMTLVVPGADRLAVTGLIVSVTATGAAESVTSFIPLPNRPSSP